MRWQATRDATLAQLWYSTVVRRRMLVLNLGMAISLLLLGGVVKP
jgi:hypothetical protein